jgi:hypothetical protein
MFYCYEPRLEAGPVLATKNGSLPEIRPVQAQNRSSGRPRFGLSRFVIDIVEDGKLGGREPRPEKV